MTTLLRSLLVCVVASVISPRGTAAAQPPAPAMPAARPIEFPSSVGEGPPREVRVISDDPAVKLVTITLRKGTALPAHSAPVPVTIQAIHGAGTIVVGQVRHRLDATHAIVLSAGTSHAIEPDAGTDMILLVHHVGRAAAAQ